MIAKPAHGKLWWRNSTRSVGISVVKRSAAARATVDEDDESFARFRREAEITSELGHPNIVQVVDFNQIEDGDPYIVMEFLEGEDLATRLKRKKRLTLEEAVRIVAQVGSALSAAHSKGIVHRRRRGRRHRSLGPPGGTGSRARRIGPQRTQ
jgi:serine/threonine protein kinase